MSSAYNGRRAPNVSAYLRELNTIQPQDNIANDDTLLEDDLSLFTNTQFFDLDYGQNTDFQAQPAESETKATSPKATTTGDASTSPVVDDLTGLGFNSGFDFGDFQNSYPAASLPNFADGVQDVPTILPDSTSVFASMLPHQQQQQQQPFLPSSARPGDKRKREGSGEAALNFEEHSKITAEEDKRRRNTAASARFRIKKKQRELALEKSAKELSDKVTALEGKVYQLETENKWLKDLIMEKNGGDKADIALLLKEFSSKQSKAKEEESKEEVKSEDN